MPTKSERSAEAAQQPRKRLYSVTAVSQALDSGRTKIYELMNTGQLPYVRIGDRRMVREEDLDAFIAGLAAERASV